MRNKKLISLFLASALTVTGTFSGALPRKAQAADDQKDMIAVYVAAEGHSSTGSQAAIGKTAVCLPKGAHGEDAVKKVLDQSEMDYDLSGGFLNSINGMGTEQVSETEWNYWSVYYNGQYANVGLGDYELQDNDRISLIYSYENTAMEASDFVDGTSLNPVQAQRDKLLSTALEEQSVLADEIYKLYFSDGSIPGIENNANGLYVAFSLLQSGYDAPDGFYQKTLDKVETQLGELKNGGKVSYTTQDEKGQQVEAELTEQSLLDSKRASMDYAKMTLFVTAMGQDATNVNGYDLIAKMLADETYNASAEAYMLAPTVLLALDSGQYAVPKDCGQSREKLVQEIVALYPNYLDMAVQYSSVDMVAMLLQALAPYQRICSSKSAPRAPTNPEFSEGVEQLVDQICTSGLHFLESMQNKDGSYGNGYQDAYGLSQVMVVLGQFGISALQEETVGAKEDAAQASSGWKADFIKNGKTVLDAAGVFVDADQKTVDATLLTYQPEQLLRGINAVVRQLQEQPALYDLSGVKKAEPTNSPAPVTVTPAGVPNSPAPMAPTTATPAGVTQSLVPTASAATPTGISASPVAAASGTSIKEAKKTIKLKKITCKRGSSVVKGTLNVKKTKVTVTIKRKGKKADLQTKLTGKSFVASLLKKQAKKLLGGKKTPAAVAQAGKLQKKDKILICIKKNGYKTLKKTYTVK